MVAVHQLAGGTPAGPIPDFQREQLMPAHHVFGPHPEEMLQLLASQGVLITQATSSGPPRAVFVPVLMLTDAMLERAFAKHLYDAARQSQFFAYLRWYAAMLQVDAQLGQQRIVLLYTNANVLLDSRLADEMATARDVTRQRLSRGEGDPAAVRRKGFWPPHDDPLESTWRGAGNLIIEQRVLDAVRQLWRMCGGPTDEELTPLDGQEP